MTAASPRLALGTCAFGRAIDADGEPLDEQPRLCGRRISIDLRVPKPNEREAIASAFWTGVRAIDGLLTFGRGARIGVFGAPGTGKSSLLEAIVEGCSADAVVVALAGERGREARQWIDARTPRTSIVCATSDRPAAERLRAAHVAIAHAAALRERGLHVLLVLDSLARIAAALRELAIARGEVVGRGGYPPTVFAQLARLVEAAGATADGSITLIASVLNDGDDRDPVSEAARSLLDGHVALCTRRAARGHFPAIDVLASTSRTMAAVVAADHLSAAAAVRRALALLERTEDARELGIDPVEPYAVAVVAEQERIEAFLRQAGPPIETGRTLAALAELADTLEGSHGHY